ncbi:MAG: hypothetical protein KY475_26730, partial [Planctomycetes bacterium]|nr:hypothetical protein [Planctomycetota bacterium]
VPEAPFAVEAGPATIRVTPLPVVHGKAEGAVIYIAEARGKKAAFAWDLETPDAAFPGGRTNLDVFQSHESVLAGADVYVQECNTWSAAGKGHTAYQASQPYFDIVRARRTLLVHMSGHEDGPGNPGYGWTDEQWSAALKKDAVEAARQGMILRVG